MSRPELHLAAFRNSTVHVDYIVECIGIEKFIFAVETLVAQV